MERFFKHPWIIVAVTAAVTVFFAMQLPRATLDNNNIRFVPADDAALTLSRHIDEEFGSSTFILVGLEREYGTVFDKEFLLRVRDYVNRIKQIDVVGNVNSIVNADYITAEGDSIIVDKLLAEDFTGTGTEIEELKRRILSWELYRNALVSDDFTATQILVPLAISAEDAGKPELVDEYMPVRDIAKEMFGGDTKVYVTGLAVISATISEAMRTDLVVLIPLVTLVVLVVLFFSFRRITAVLLPLLTVLVSTIWAMGAMPLFGIKLTILSTVLPVILVAVGSAYGIHVLTHYLSEVSVREGMSRGEHNALVFAMLRRIGKAVLLAALTTFAGFVSFCFTRVLPIREWGIFASFGVIVSFAVSMTLIPALLLIRGPKPMRKIGASRAGASADETSTALAAALAAVSCKRRFILFLSTAVLAVSVWGASKVIIDNVFVEYFKDSTDIARSDKFIREKFGGSRTVNLVMEADTPKILLHPDSLGAMDDLSTYMQTEIPEVGKTMGFTDLIKRINQVFNANESPDGLKKLTTNSTNAEESADDFGFGFADESSASDESVSTTNDTVTTGDANPVLAKTYTIGEIMDLFDRAVSAEGLDTTASGLTYSLKRLVNYGGAAYYEIPRDPERYGKEKPEELQGLVSNYLVLLSGSIDSYANDPLEPTAIKMAIQLRTTGGRDTADVMKLIQHYIDERFPKNVDTTVGGTVMVEASLNNLVVQSQLTSLVISLVIVFLIVALSNKSLAAGIIAVVPLVIAILINFAVMGFAGIKLNIGTSMVASLSVGIGIDYTIHCMEAFKREYRASGGTGDYLRKTFSTAGMAIIINAVSVGAGFAVLMLSQFVILRDLGLLIALTMAVSALVSLTLIPVLISSIKPKFIFNQGVSI